MIIDIKLLGTIKQALDGLAESGQRIDLASGESYISAYPVKLDGSKKPVMRVDIKEIGGKNGRKKPRDGHEKRNQRG